MNDKENQKQASPLPAEALEKEGAKGYGEPKEDLQKKVAATEGGEPRPEDSGREELQKQLEDCEKKAAEYLSGWQRERADFLNYKKEGMERIGHLINYAKEEFVLDILPIIDNFDVIEKKLPEDLKKDENTKGLLQTKIQFRDFLKGLGVEEIKALGEIFDAKLHEVVEEIEPFGAAHGKEIKSGTIIEEVQKGYKINGRLLRAARVRVVK